ncbi:MAG: hypothetical protein SPI12_03635 [Actinomycetaceae bacterium]|nr:hypothetical protein [Actinomycetaceae bacterium]MDY6082936.1 hypothetical protein [Actinomycetaceae bacterium]
MSSLRFFGIALIPYGVGLAVASVVTFRVNSVGFLPVSYVVLGIVEVLICVTIGSICGALLSGWFSSVCAFLITFIILQVNWNGRKDSINVTSGYPHSVLNIGKVSVLAIFTLLILLAASYYGGVAPLVSRHWLPRHYAVVSLVLSAAFVVALIPTLVLMPPFVQERQGGAEALCTHTSPRICVWPDNRKYMPELEVLSRNMHRLSEYGLEVPDRFMEQGLADPKDASSAPFNIDGGSTWFASSDWAINVVAQMTDGIIPPDETTDDYYRHLWMLQAWADVTIHAGADSPLSGGPDVDMKMIRQIAAQPFDQQRQWVRQQLDALAALGQGIPVKE